MVMRFIHGGEILSEGLRMWTETIFNIAYLIIIWSLVITMICKFKKVDYRRVSTAKCFLWAYFLLALGDTGHVGFRAYAYLSGGLERYKELVGMGTLATAVTVTLFYVLMNFVWENRYNKRFNFIVKKREGKPLRPTFTLFRGFGEIHSLSFTVLCPFIWTFYPFALAYMCCFFFFSYQYIPPAIGINRSNSHQGKLTGRYPSA
jgi:hypothetical protein